MEKEEQKESCQYISTAIIAKQLSVSQRCIQAACMTGALKAKRFGNRYRIELRDFEEWKEKVLKSVQEE